MPSALKEPSLPSGRIRAIDWLRGLSVVFMIECHSLIFLAPRFEFTPLWYWIQNINGLVSSAFLFTAGFAGGLVGSRAAKDSAARRRRTKRTFLRLAQVLGMSVYFHFACNPIFAQPTTLLRVDILLCIAMGVLAVWGAVTLCRGNNSVAIALLLSAALVVIVMTPWAWRYRGGVVATELLNGTTGSMFPICPWLLYPLLGAGMGVIGAEPARGRRRLIYAMTALLGVTWALCLPTAGPRFWAHLSTDQDLFWVRNAVERIWKLSFILLSLLVIDWGSVRLAHFPWARLFTPIERGMEYFSRHALVAYLVHLSLLYGFLNIQLTRQWHGKSTWDEYTWRMLLVIAGTAFVCHAIHRARRMIESAIRGAVPTPANQIAIAKIGR